MNTRTSVTYWEGVKYDMSGNVVLEISGGIISIYLTKMKGVSFIVGSKFLVQSYLKNHHVKSIFKPNQKCYNHYICS